MNGFKRLTTDKPNGMYELAHNSCYIGDDGAARYRDFEIDIDARDLTRKLMVSFGQWKSAEEYGLDADNELIDDDIFDDSMMELLSFDNTAISGLIALFYRNLWAMADLRERLKQYEDAEEQGLLVKFPCKVGDTVYFIAPNYKKCPDTYQCDDYDSDEYLITWCENNCPNGYKGIGAVKAVVNGFKIWSSTVCFQTVFGSRQLKEIGKTVFLTKEEAEAALAKMESEV